MLFSNMFPLVGRVSESLVTIAENLTKPKVAVVVVTLAIVGLFHQLAGDYVCSHLTDGTSFERCVQSRNNSLILIFKELL